MEKAVCAIPLAGVGGAYLQRKLSGKKYTQNAAVDDLWARGLGAIYIFSSFSDLVFKYSKIQMHSNRNNYKEI